MIQVEGRIAFVLVDIRVDGLWGAVTDDDDDGARVRIADGLGWGVGVCIGVGSKVGIVEFVFVWAGGGRGSAMMTIARLPPPEYVSNHSTAVV
jgi:hypothetical protein